MIRFIMLLQDVHRPVPHGIEVQVFGRETVRDDNGGIHAGESAYIEGDEEVIKNWLRQFDGFWTSNNPLIGNWEINHIK